jgi:flagellar biosynthetic protein FlhB
LAEGGERTERATPRQRRKARERGQVARSNELTSALLLLALFVTLSAASDRTGGLFRALTLDTIGRADQLRLDQSTIMRYTAEWVAASLNILAPFFLVAIAVGLLTQVAQTGGIVSAHPLQPDLSRLNPVRGFQRLFSLRGFVELAKSLAKLAVVGIIVYVILKTEMFNFPGLIGASIESSFASSFGIALRIGIWTSVALLILAIFDYAYQVYEFEKGIRMTKQEVKDELKTEEGDPLIKRTLRERGRQIAFTRMMKRAAEADVVITNPTHYSVAILYEFGMTAPRVTAKGKGYIALKIREVARENGVPIVEDPPLARALYATEIDDYIPAEHFRAVAQILAFLARSNERIKARLVAQQ